MIICRTNYFNDIRPADPQTKKTGGYLEAVATARHHFTSGKEDAFRAYLVEAKYGADLWAAHLLLEYGQPDGAVRKECLDVIRRYAAATFDSVLAHQEQQWLEAYTKEGVES